MTRASRAEASTTRPSTTRASTLRGRLLRPQGFTLLEVTIVAMLSGVLFLILLRWVTGLLGASGNNQDVSDVQRSVQSVVDTFAQDTSRATVCDPNGMGSDFRQIQTSSVQMYEPNSSGSVDLVVWRVSGSTLERGVVAGGGGCGFTDTQVSSATYKVVAENLVTALPFTFAGVVQGTDRTSASDYGDCTGIASTSSTAKPGAEGCLYDGVHLHVKLTSLGSNANPGEVNQVFSVLESGTRLGRTS